MVVETPDGETLDIVKQALSDYSMIISGKRKPEDFINDPLQVLEMKGHIRTLKAQMENQRELYQEMRHRDERTIDWLQQELALALSKSRDHHDQAIKQNTHL